MGRDKKQNATKHIPITNLQAHGRNSVDVFSWTSDVRETDNLPTWTTAHEKMTKRLSCAPTVTCHGLLSLSSAGKGTLLYTSVPVNPFFVFSPSPIPSLIFIFTPAARARSGKEPVAVCTVVATLTTRRMATLPLTGLLSFGHTDQCSYEEVGPPHLVALNLDSDMQMAGSGLPRH